MSFKWILCQALGKLFKCLCMFYLLAVFADLYVNTLSFWYNEEIVQELPSVGDSATQLLCCLNITLTK